MSCASSPRTLNRPVRQLWQYARHSCFRGALTAIPEVREGIVECPSNAAALLAATGTPLGLERRLALAIRRVLAVRGEVLRELVVGGRSDSPANTAPEGRLGCRENRVPLGGLVTSLLKVGNELARDGVG